MAPSEIAAARAMLGEIAIGGHLPVTIPGQAAYGEGIQLRHAGHHGHWRRAVSACLTSRAFSA